MTKSNMEVAQENLYWLAENPYPGRGIIVGLDETAQYFVQIYWIMGRSQNSRNRLFQSDDNGRLYTELADGTQESDPSLIIYNAMLEKHPYYIVSNGDQTDTVIHSSNIHNLDQALAQRTYEPDAPNFTQRITALTLLRSANTPLLQMSILRKSNHGDLCDRRWYERNPVPGFGYCITTYEGDGNPLPPFCREPLLMPLAGKPEKIMETCWNALDQDNRVSLAVKFIKKSTGESAVWITNKYQKVTTTWDKT